MDSFIQTTEDLNALCDRLSRFAYVTVDTEFIREKTYWPQLCLIQIASREEAVCIDPLAKDLDMRAFFALLQNENVVKVFHAAHQDIEIFYHMTREIPKPLFDTQLAAMVCGFGESVSYQNLVKKLLDRDLDKSMRFTDWSQRPLTEKQISYALADVTHLRDVYEKMTEILAENGRSSWLDDDARRLKQPSTYEIDSREAWKRLKLNTTKPLCLALCRELAAFREDEAKRLNRPRKHIMRDEVLMEIATNIPSSVNELASLRGIPEGFAKGRMGRLIMDIVKDVKAADPATYPKAEKPFEVPRHARAVAKMLKLLLMIQAADNDVAEKMIAGFDDLDKFAVSSPETSPLLQGWRYDVFGKAALDLKQGKIGFVYNPKKCKIDIVKICD